MKPPKIVISKKELEERILEMAVEINAFYREEPLLVLGATRGAFIFTADLVRKISWEYEVDFLQTLEEGDEELRFAILGNRNLENYHVLLVHEVIGSGESCLKILDHLEKQGPKSIRICTLLDKPALRSSELQPHWKGFKMENQWVVGYGLDQEEKFRNLPYIGSLEVV